MKVKALLPFISGRVSGIAGDIIDNVPEGKAEKLAALGFVEIVGKGGKNEKGDSAPLSSPQTVETTSDDKTPAEKKTTAKSAKSGGKTTGKK